MYTYRVGVAHGLEEEKPVDCDPEFAAAHESIWLVSTPISVDDVDELHLEVVVVYLVESHELDLVLAVQCAEDVLLLRQVTPVIKHSTEANVALLHRR